MFGELDILSFARISRWNWIDHINRADSKSSQVFNNNPQGIRIRGRPKKKNRRWNCVQTDIDRCKIKNLREVKKQT
jgi:hypothetical protein